MVTKSSKDTRYHNNESVFYFNNNCPQPFQLTPNTVERVFCLLPMYGSKIKCHKNDVNK